MRNLTKTLMTCAAVIALSAGSAAAQTYDTTTSGQTSASDYTTMDTNTGMHGSATGTSNIGEPDATTGTSVGSTLGNTGTMGTDRGSLSTDLSSTQTYDLQRMLRNRGYEPGPIDGVMGPRTADAIRQFQQDNDLTATGQLNAETMAELGVNTRAQTGAGLDNTSIDRNVEGNTMDQQRRGSVDTNVGAGATGTMGTDMNSDSSMDSGM